ncbi:MAG: hypothetical protein PVI90_11405, partial [Desulfobacteraceae bacterium]
PLPQWTDEVGRKLIPLPEVDLFLEQETLSLSFFPAVGKLSAFQSISNIKEKLLFKASAWTWILTFLLLIVSLGLLGTGGYLAKSTQELENRTKALEKQYSKVNSSIPVLSSAVTYRSTLNFIEELARNKKAPDYKEILSDLATAIPEGMRLEVLKLNYSPTELKLELFGPIKAPFDQAHNGYQEFLKITGQKGYKIIESRFDTVIDESQMFVHMVKRWG